MKGDLERDGAIFTSFDGTASVSPDIVIGPPAASQYRQQYMRRLAAEKLKRQIEPTKLYEPMPEQERFHKSNAKQRILRGCIAGETEIYDPVAGVSRRVDEIDADFHVYSWDGDKMVIAAAHKPFLKGIDDLYRVTLDNGAEFISTLDHRVWTQDGWLSVGAAYERLRRSEQVLLPSTAAPSRQASLQGEPSCSRTTQGSRDGYRPSYRSCGEPLRAALGSVPASVPSQDDAPELSCASSHRDDRGNTQGCSRPRHGDDRLSTQDGPRHASGLGIASHSRSDEGLCSSRRDAALSVRQSPQPSCHRRTTASYRQSASRDAAYHGTRHCASAGCSSPTSAYSQGDHQSAVESGRTQHTVAPLPVLDRESTVVSIEYVRTDKFYDLTVPLYHCYECRTVLHHNSNRAGKTLTACVELAFIISRRHPYLKFPKTGRAICVGSDEKHIGHTMWDKLVNPIPKLRMIKDEYTRQWRVYRHWTDKHREREARPMLPLIPPRLIEHISYRDKGTNCPAVVILKTGWELWWFTGGSNPPRGLDVDYVWFDEEIANPEFHKESMARLVDRAGRFVWSATPQTGGPSMYDLHSVCDEYVRTKVENPPAEEFHLTIDGNKYLDRSEVESLKETYKNDPEAYRVRILGEYAADAFRVYPTFNVSNHVIEPIHIGDDWARFLSIDPGHVTTAVLFWAVPPDGKHAYIYDELYIRDTNDSEIAAKIKHKATGFNFQAFILDYHGSIRTEMSGLTIGQQISDQFRKAGLVSNATGSGFITPSGSIESGLSKVREWLAPTADGKPFLQIFNGCADNLVFEMKRYMKKVEHGVPTDKPDQRGKHAVDALRYAAVHGLKYYKPRKGNKIQNPIIAWAKSKRKKRSKSAVVLGHTAGIS